MNVLIILSTPEKRKIYIAGKELSHSNIQSIRGMIAWVPQELQLPYETVREVIKAPFSLKINNNQTFDENRYINLLFELGVDGKKIIDKSLREISGGERQRVMIALAVLLNKKILLLDEPTSAVDIYTREKIISFIKKLQATVMIVTHDEQLAGSCNQVIRLKKN